MPGGQTTGEDAKAMGNFPKINVRNAIARKESFVEYCGVKYFNGIEKRH